MVAIPKITKRFETSLAFGLSAAGTSFTLESAIDEDGNALSGLYGMTIDVGNSNVEDFIATISGTTVTVVARGIDADSPITEVSANKKAHRRGAPVVITDYPILAYLRNILNAETGFELPSHLKYASNTSFTDNEELITKRYADALAIAGAPDSSTTVKGLVEKATSSEIDSGASSGGTSAPLAVSPDQLAASIYNSQLPSSGQKSALASTTTPGSGNKYISQTDFQKGAEIYAASSAGTDTYAITLSPAPAAYTTGQVFRFKADVANTGAATLNVNSLGAKSILRPDGSALANGDIAASQFVQVIYDGTNMLLLSPLANSPKIAHGQTTYTGDAASSTQNIAHGLGRIPRFIRLSALKSFATDASAYSELTYDGTTGVGIFTSRTSGGAQTSSIQTGLTIYDSGGGANNQTAVVTFDATNIILTWTKTGSPNAASINIHWEAYA